MNFTFDNERMIDLLTIRGKWLKEK